MTLTLTLRLLAFSARDSRVGSRRHDDEGW